MPDTLYFSQGNAKLDQAITIFSLPAGWTCPYASACLSKADPKTGRLQDGPHTEHRCFAATAENRFSSLRRRVWHNLRLLKACKSVKQMTKLILRSLSPLARLVRIHVGGDFFNLRYLDAWLRVARERPRADFYGYTKSLPLVVKRIDTFPANFRVVASYGGTKDELIAQYGLVAARVVLSEEEAAALGLEIDHDDSHALAADHDFALLIHGPQPAGSSASRAVQTLREQGVYGYSRKKTGKISLSTLTLG